MGDRRYSRAAEHAPIPCNPQKILPLARRIALPGWPISGLRRACCESGDPFCSLPQSGVPRTYNAKRWWVQVRWRFGRPSELAYKSLSYYTKTISGSRMRQRHRPEPHGYPFALFYRQPQRQEAGGSRPSSPTLRDPQSHDVGAQLIEATLKNTTRRKTEAAQKQHLTHHHYCKN